MSWWRKLLASARASATVIFTMSNQINLVLTHQGLLTHGGLMTHTCTLVNHWTIIGSENGVSPVWHQAIIWTAVGLLSIKSFEANFSEIFRKIQTFTLDKIYFKMSAISSQLQWIYLKIFSTPHLAHYTLHTVYIPCKGCIENQIGWTVTNLYLIFKIDKNDIPIQRVMVPGHLQAVIISPLSPLQRQLLCAQFLQVQFDGLVQVCGTITLEELPQSCTKPVKWQCTRFHIPYHLLVRGLTHLPWTKWPPFRIWYFQMHYLEWKYLYFD